MSDRNKLRDVLDNIYNAIVHLPKPIRRVCYVQIFAFMGWYVHCHIRVVAVFLPDAPGSPSSSMRK